MPRPDRRQLSMRFDEEDMDRLTQLAEDEGGVSLAALVRRAVRTMLDEATEVTE